LSGRVSMSTDNVGRHFDVSLSADIVGPTLSGRVSMSTDNVGR